MTGITMADSVDPQNLPPGFDAYLAYADGNWPTAAAVRAAHPQARLVVLTVFGGTLAADGVDCEPGNVNAVQAAAWAAAKLAAAPSSRPVVYADLESPGYSMAEVLAALAALGIARARVRLLTAHYTGEAHICSPPACPVAFTADATQYTDAFPGVNGALIDMSLLAAGFFGAPPAPESWEDIVASVPVIAKGSADVQAVRNWQGLLIAHGYNIGTSGLRKDGVDGDFADATDRATRQFQKSAGIKVDGEVGPVTYGAALAG